MKIDMASIKRDYESLRYDLIASNMAHLALLSTLSNEQQSQVLAAYVKLTVQQEETVAKANRPELLAQMQAAHQRLYSGLQGVVKMKQAGLI